MTEKYKISFVSFLVMPKIKGQPKEMIAYRCPPNLLKRIDDSITQGDFSTRPEVITAALRFYYENRLTEQDRNYLESWKRAVNNNPDFMIDLMREIKKEQVQKKHGGGKEE
ncbi:MAG: hypothetical protein Q8O19_01975 [Rectinemataceae bacterium]|nr:hypothetical protein [Rectinemataceae bacterium]